MPKKLPAPTVEQLLQNATQHEKFGEEINSFLKGKSKAFKRKFLELFFHSEQRKELEKLYNRVRKTNPKVQTHRDFLIGYTYFIRRESQPIRFLALGEGEKVFSIRIAVDLRYPWEEIQKSFEQEVYPVRQLLFNETSFPPGHSVLKKKKKPNLVQHAYLARKIYLYREEYPGSLRGKHRTFKTIAKELGLTESNTQKLYISYREDLGPRSNRSL